jgi:hypothetical protein
LLEQHDFNDCAGRELLAEVCEAVDRAEQLKAEIDADGLVIRTRSGTVKAHPAINAEVVCRAFVAKGLTKLGVLYEPIRHPGRP